MLGHGEAEGGNVGVDFGAVLDEGGEFVQKYVLEWEEGLEFVEGGLGVVVEIRGLDEADVVVCGHDLEWDFQRLLEEGLGDMGKDPGLESGLEFSGGVEDGTGTGSMAKAVGGDEASDRFHVSGLSFQA